MPHGRFSGAVFNMWLHSSCCGDLATATAVACMSFAHPALGQPSDLLTTGPWSFLELPLQWFGLVSAKQHVWGGPCSSRFSAVVLCPVYVCDAATTGPGPGEAAKPSQVCLVVLSLHLG